MNDKSNIQPRAKIMWYFEPRIERKKSRYRSTFLVRLLGSKYFIILALVGYLLYIHQRVPHSQNQVQREITFSNMPIFVAI